MKKKNLIFILIVFLIGILLINFSSAIESSYCCERLKNDGPWCMNALSNECATGINPFSSSGESYKKVPTSCEATSYCQLGTCINSVQGTCMTNTPQVVCNNNKGLWKAENIEDLPECTLGCCLLGNQAAFVTQTECKKLSSEFGLTTNYRKDITSELECIASITTDEIGACVFEKEYETTCLMITQKECVGDIKGVFHSGFLCSAKQLATNCGPRGGTTCFDESVYFLDTCNNIANIYDASKLTDDNDYWTYIQEPSCDNEKGNKNSKTCGACDYFSGSICQNYERGKTIKPNYGEAFCGSLDCSYDENKNGRIESGENHLHGETWCATNVKSPDNANAPGSRYFRMLCYNGEVIIEPCSEFRQEVCIESEVNDYSVAGCVVNRWQDCVNQSSKDTCEDVYARDCKWIEGYSILKDSKGNNLGFTTKEVCSGLFDGRLCNEIQIPGSCVPKSPPGFDFWAGEGYGPEICNVGSSTCVVRYEVGVLASRKKLEQKDWDEKKEKCVENCYCIPGYKKGDTKKDSKYAKTNPPFDGYDEWTNAMNNICTALGDCGNKENYLGFSGDIKEVFTSEFVKKP